MINFKKFAKRLKYNYVKKTALKKVLKGSKYDYAKKELSMVDCIKAINHEKIVVCLAKYLPID